MSYKLNPNKSFLRPVTQELSMTKVQLNESKTFGNDKLIEDTEGNTPNAGKFVDGGVGYLAVEDGNRLGLAAYKTAIIVESFMFKNMSSADLRRVRVDGSVVAIAEYPVTLLAGEDLQLEGAATAADNWIGITMRKEAREVL